MCREATARVLALLNQLEIELLPVTVDKVASLGCNILALGGMRVISTGSAPRVDDVLRARGIQVDAVELDDFTQCGVGVHCLTMPLRRDPPDHKTTFCSQPNFETSGP